jgi:sensor histidine kinase regulating citrate/malate metabolism
VLQATLDSVREGVGAVDDRGRLRAWNNSLLAMLGVSGADLRPGTSLPLGNDANRVGQRIRELEAAVRATGAANSGGAQGRKRNRG